MQRERDGKARGRKQKRRIVDKIKSKKNYSSEKTKLREDGAEMQASGRYRGSHQKKKKKKN